MIQFTIRDGLPFVTVVATYAGLSAALTRVLIDTGSASTCFSTDQLAQLAVAPDLTDTVRYLRGIGGLEPVIEKRLDAITLGTLTVTSFPIQMGAMDYGIPIDGIIGTDFLLATGAVLDFVTQTIGRASST